MLFIVDSKESRQRKLDHYPHVILVKDNWDDYGYKTTFNATLHLSADEEVELGVVRILRDDQKSGSTKMPPRPFEDLDIGYCSFGENLEYYTTLHKQGRSIYEPYLRALRDVTFNDDIKADFEDLEGFRVSLLRFSNSTTMMAEASKLFKRAVPKLRRRNSGFKVKFKTKAADDSNPVTINLDFRRRKTLPGRINVLIGYNGTGKTKIMSNLAIVSSGYGYDSKEHLLNRTAGRFIGNQPPFETVIVVSYSAFDSFAIPGRNRIEKARILAKGEIFGYVYCGLRELVDHSNDIQAYRLKSQKKIELEFLASLDRINKSQRFSALLEILEPLFSDPSFRRIGLNQFYEEHNRGRFAELFRGLSSGHKVVLKIATDLTAHMAETGSTLVLIDEPETHLHPPLLAALLKSIRTCLEHFDGYAVIATHSPVVLQEIPSRFVHVLRRVTGHSRIDATSIETFGESVGVLTQEVFNLNDGSTDWHDTLRSLAQEHSLEEIEYMFGNSLGFAARSYILSVHDEAEG